MDRELSISTVILKNEIQEDFVGNGIWEKCREVQIKGMASIYSNVEFPLNK